MKLLWILLILAVGMADGAQTKLNPATDINWTKDIGSQLHDVTNGTSAQDAVTYSQLVACSNTSALMVTVGINSTNQYIIDGTDDDHTINTAMEYAEDRGITNVALENGRYNITGPVTIPAHLWLHGTSYPDYSGADSIHIDTSYPYHCAQMAITYADGPAFEMGYSSQLTHMEFYYPSNNVYGEYESLIPYPATINMSDACEVGWVHPANPWFFINMTRVPSILGYIHDVTGYFLNRGIYVFYNAHGLEIRNCDFLPSFCGLQLGGSVFNEVAANGTCILMNAADAMLIDDIQAWDMGYGVRSIEGPYWWLSGRIMNCMFDEVAHPIVLNHTSEMLVTNNRLLAMRGAWVDGSHVSYYDSGSYGVYSNDALGIQITNNRFYTADSAVCASYSAGIVSNNLIATWSLKPTGAAPALKFESCTSVPLSGGAPDGSSLVVDGNVLQDYYNQGIDTWGIYISNSNNFTISGNTGKATGWGVAVENAATNDYIVTDNNIRSYGLYNAASGATRKVIDNNLW